MINILKKGTISSLVALFVLVMFAGVGFAQTEVNSKYQLDAKAEVKGTTIDVWAKVIGANTVDSGEWQIVPLGPNKAGKPAHAQQSTSAEFHAKYENLKPNVEYCFNIHFTGKVNGETANTVLKLTGKKGMICATTGEPDQEEPSKEEPNKEEPNKEEPQPQPCPAEPSPEDFHDIVVDTKQAANGKVKVTAKLDGKEAEGTWYLAAGPEAADRPVIYEELKDVKGTTFTYELDVNKLPAGENMVVVAFEGTVDGKNCQVGFGGTGIIVEDDTVKPDPDNKPQKPATPEKGKEAVDKLKGGKLPKTATSYPVSMMLGGLLLVSGFGLLMFRRTV